MSKFLLNLLLQFSRALVYSKIKSLFGKEFFPHFWPNRPNGQPAHPVFRPSRGPLFFTNRLLPSPHWASASRPAQPALTAQPDNLPPPAPEQSAPAATAGRPRAAPWSAPTTSTKGKIMAASLLLHSPIKRCHSLSSILGNRRLQAGGIEASSTPAIEGTCPPPPPPRLRPIKGHPTLGEDPHTSNTPSLSPQRALTATLLSRRSAAGETPLHRLPNHGKPVVEFACPSFPSPAPWSELSGTGVAGGRASVSSRAQQWPPVHGGPGWRGPRTRGLGPRWTGPTPSTNSWTWSTDNS
jgi:hypothetical protein